ncbi:MAG TPA: DUF5808 domain-containing protein [Verrucomicrobiaceae bacterium]|jgi:hypothetical protein
MNQAQLDLLWCDPGNWRLGLFYFCRKDPRVVVPKRMRGLGWTLNLARPLALPFAALTVTAVWQLLELAGRFPKDGLAQLAIYAGGLLGLCSVLSRLSRPQFRPDHNPDGSSNER